MAKDVSPHDDSARSVEAPAASDDDRPTPSEVASTLRRFVFFLIRLVIVTIIVFFFLATISDVTIRHFISGTEVVAPSIIGYTVEEAVQSLSQYDLSIKESGRDFNEIVKKGTIISQYPEAGTKVKVGTPIKVVISDGPEMVVIPDVRGETYLKAGIEIRSKDLQVEHTTYIYDPQIEKDAVIAQDPPPQAKAPRFYKVGLLVSLGKEPQTLSMPGLLSLTLPEARHLLALMNLSIGSTSLKAETRVGANIIVGQQPTAGTTVNPETPITIIVSSGR